MFCVDSGVKLVVSVTKVSLPPSQNLSVESILSSSMKCSEIGPVLVDQAGDIFDFF